VRAATEGLTYFLELSGLITCWPTTKAAGDSTYHLTETVALVTAPLFCFLDCESDGPAHSIGINGAAGTVNKYLLAASFDVPATSKRHKSEWILRRRRVQAQSTDRILERQSKCRALKRKLPLPTHNFNH
jgi:hypothetical protein